MKRGLFLLIIVILLNFCGCTGNYKEYSKQNGKLENKENNNTSVLVTKESTTKNSKIIDDWFATGTFKEIKQLKSKIYLQKSEKVTKNKLVGLTKNPLGLSNWELVTNNSKIIKYQFEDIEYFQKDGEKDIQYYDMSEDISKDIFYSNLSDNGISLIIDFSNNVIVFLKNEYEQKSVIGAYKFTSEFSLKDLVVLGGYKDKDGYKAVFSYKDNYLYTIDINSMKVVYKKRLNGYKFISGYVESNNNIGDENLYSYFINESENKIKKIKLPEEKVMFEMVIDKRIQGQIKRIEQDGLGGIYILANMKDKQAIYFTDENDFKYMLIKESDIDGKIFNSIDDTKYYWQNEKAMYLILLEKTKNIPVRMIETDDLTWNELK